MYISANAKRLVLSGSEREILNIVRRQGSISRADITAHTNLSQQSVHRIVDGLIQRRLLATQKAIVKGRGKPSPQIILDTASSASIGVSLSTNIIEYTAVDLSGRTICDGALNAAPNDREAALAELANLTSELAGSGPLADRRFIGIGVAVQGYRTTHRNRFTTPVPLDNWARVPIDEIFEKHLKYASFVENNATSAAIAELYCGGGKSHGCFGYLSFNLGFGCGIIWDEKPVFGGHGNAGEISSIFLDDEAPHRPALGELQKRLSDRGLKLTFQQLLDEFDPEWPGVAEWIEEVRPNLNLVIRGLSSILDPNAIFFGGEAPAELRKLLIEACGPAEKDRFGITKPYPELLLSDISGDAATLGAAMLPLQQIVFRNHAF
ncbi:ROK family transcriptional regulator [Hoeflea sp. TYP-13]|uniref:ROK family transcriptional regulator n=1 Tax=Hoeflea sp. TYP-13 TaxID=3230023 RepID=UPI0034C695A3